MTQSQHPLAGRFLSIKALAHLQPLDPNRASLVFLDLSVNYFFNVLKACKWLHGFQPSTIKTLFVIIWLRKRRKNSLDKNYGMNNTVRYLGKCFWRHLIKKEHRDRKKSLSYNGSKSYFKTKSRNNYNIKTKIIAHDDKSDWDGNDEWNPGIWVETVMLGRYIVIL